MLVFENTSGGDSSDDSRSAGPAQDWVWGRGERARGVRALATLLAFATALVCESQWLYGAAEVQLLPLPLLLGGVGLVLVAGALSAVTVFRLKVAGRTGTSAGVHQPAVFIALLLCGFALPVCELQFTEPGYLHPLLVRCHRN